MSASKTNTEVPAVLFNLPLPNIPRASEKKTKIITANQIKKTAQQCLTTISSPSSRKISASISAPYRSPATIATAAASHLILSKKDSKPTLHYMDPIAKALPIGMRPPFSSLYKT